MREVIAQCQRPTQNNLPQRSPRHQSRNFQHILAQSLVSMSKRSGLNGGEHTELLQIILRTTLHTTAQGIPAPSLLGCVTSLPSDEALQPRSGGINQIATACTASETVLGAGSRPCMSSTLLRGSKPETTLFCLLLTQLLLCGKLDAGRRRSRRGHKSSYFLLQAHVCLDHIGRTHSHRDHRICHPLAGSCRI